MPRSTIKTVRRGFGRRLARARAEAGLSQRDLAFPGCTAAYISRLEADARHPSLQMVGELARRLAVDPHWLATGRRSTDAISVALVAGYEMTKAVRDLFADEALGRSPAVRKALAATTRFEMALAAAPSELRP